MNPDGFEELASCSFLVRRPRAVAWRVIGPEDQVEDMLPAGIVHVITTERGPGEHDCVLEGTWQGRAISAPGTRRLDARSHVITEWRRHSGEDHLVITTLDRTWRGRTRITMTGLFRPTGGTPDPATFDAVRTSWAEQLSGRQESAVRAIESAQR